MRKQGFSFGYPAVSAAGRFIMKLNNVSQGDKVEVRIYPVHNGLAELRCWCKSKLVDVQKAKTHDLQIAAFSL